MRHMSSAPSTPVFALPRGWVVLGAALASWLVVLALWAGLAQAFALVSALLW
ncbi:hypothetical protein [Devosia sp.]|uniref:hypothetical protein n=1 Tax=Devosia sp. TaxID=1871048 RepID=UPI002AFEA910|nr:hypothetical protein [Devosia sp.]